ncbi:unnamed protein product [Symbiodinium sp. CCMP2456]|nr:unnamed protein product [Symbiodinium sp. CCMP2456]
MATVQPTMTMEALVGGLETEAGSEPHFCPVKALPIKRTHRVRTLPGFHLLCLDAGKEAMARGSYEAFGQRFHCESLQYLHQDDKVFICPQDQKAFLNQMSMRYHQYIRHELQERKEERKRLRERAEERKARADRHRQQPDSLSARAVAADPAPVAPTAPTAPAAPAAPALPDPGLERTSLASDVPETPPPVINEDFPEVKLPKPRNEADPRLASTLTPLPVQTPMTPAPSTQKPPVDDDLYGDLGGEQAKRQKTGSAYASAMTAMMTGDFDDDDCDEIPGRMLLKLLAALTTAHVAAASDASLEDAALSLIQGHARKIVKTKGSKLATQLSATDALADFEGGAGLSLIQGNQCRLNVDEHCAAPAGARRVKKAVDPAMSAAVADGIEDGVAALSLFQVTRGSWRKGDECHGSVRDVVADEATTDQAADSAATSLIQQERSKIKVRRASVEGP